MFDRCGRNASGRGVAPSWGRRPRFLRGRETEGNLDEAQGLCADPRNHAWVLIKCP